MNFLEKRCLENLSLREAAGLYRKRRTWASENATLNLANNDYLGLATHPEVKKAAIEATERFGCSSSASPLVTGFLPPHESLVKRLAEWHGVTSEQVMLWNSGFSANRCVLGILSQKGDLVLADRLVHNSMLAGILSSGAQLIRFDHLDLEHLESLLKQKASGRNVFVATESVFGMDGDSPDLESLTALKDRYGFCLVLDEAHALGWYGKKGSGLGEQTELLEEIDVLVATLGKGLGSQGAYTVFKEPSCRKLLENLAGDYVYSTFLSPACAAASCKAIELAEGFVLERPNWQKSAAAFRYELKSSGLKTIPGNSPVIPIVLKENDLVVQAADNLLEKGIKVASIRPPTVPEGTARLRLSLKAGMQLEGLAKTLADSIP